MVLVFSILLIAGGNKALSALSTAIIAIGLPCTVMLCFICIACKVALDMELHEDTQIHLTVDEGRYAKYFVGDNGEENWHYSITGVLRIMDFLLRSDANPPAPECQPAFLAFFGLKIGCQLKSTLCVSLVSAWY